MSRFTQDDVVDCLKLEREVLTKGGYGCSVRDPRNPPRYLRDSVTCLNHAFESKRRSCGECVLIDFVPTDKRSETIPCHHIALNGRGDTLASLDGTKRERVESTLLGWLDAVLTREE